MPDRWRPCTDWQPQGATPSGGSEDMSANVARPELHLLQDHRRPDPVARRCTRTTIIFVFHDIHPWAPVHFLLVPKQHIASMAQVGPEHAATDGPHHDAGAPARPSSRAAIRTPQGGFRIVVQQRRRRRAGSAPSARARHGWSAALAARLRPPSTPRRAVAGIAARQGAEILPGLRIPPIAAVASFPIWRNSWVHFSIWHWLIVLLDRGDGVRHQEAQATSGSDLGGAVKGFKDGIKDGGQNPADIAAAPASRAGDAGNTRADKNAIDVEAKSEKSDAQAAGMHTRHQHPGDPSPDIARRMADT
jgi:sec-independent protein translocase protein TatA